MTNKVLKGAVFSAFIFAVHALTAVPANSKELLSASSSGTSMQEHFSAIKDFFSYDPATNQWSKIKDFSTIKFLEKDTAMPSDEYLYRSFWAHDAVTNQWHQVDINKYAYKPAAMPLDIADTVRASTEAHDQVAPMKAAAQQKTSGRVFPNFAIGMKLGGGYVREDISWSKMKCKPSKDSDSTLTFAAQHEDNLKKVRIIELSLPGSEAIILSDREEEEERKEWKEWKKWEKETRIGSGIVTHAINVPLSLYAHHTFFNRVRVGAGVKVDAYKCFYKVTGKDKIQSKGVIFRNPGFHVTMGWNLLKGTDSSLALDFKLGRAYNFSQSGWASITKLQIPGLIERGGAFGSELVYARRLDRSYNMTVGFGLNVEQTGKASTRSTDSAWIGSDTFAPHFTVGLQYNPAKSSTT